MSLPIRLSARLVVVGTLMALVAALAGCGEPAASVEPPNPPPSQPTHHAVITGRVMVASGALAGDGMESVGVGARFSHTASADRRVSVVGGGAVDAAGAYRFTVGASRPVRADATGEVLFVFVRIGPAGAWRREVDSVRIAVRFAPESDAPPITLLPDRILR